MQEDDYIKGRGSQFRTANPYEKHRVEDSENGDGQDEPLIQNVKTQVFFDYPKTIVNKVKSPDVKMEWSLNAYQGCEHGCIYCYARNSHQYWGYSAGLDFESKLIVKPNAPELLRKCFDSKKWKPEVISMSGNTDCYQPLEKEYKLTRQLLEIFAEYRNPVGMITKNQLILRDLDILKELASHNLLNVAISITSLNEDLRLKLEPRTASYKNRLKVVETLASNGIHVGVMVAPIIPGLNNYDIAHVIKAASEAGASWAGYTLVRLSGSVEPLFDDWLKKNYPDSYDKVMNQIKDCHNGQLYDSAFGKRMRGEGKIAETINQLFKTARKKYMGDKPAYEFNLTAFRRPERGQLSLF